MNLINKKLLKFSLGFWAYSPYRCSREREKSQVTHPSVKHSMPSGLLRSSLFSCGKAYKRRDRSSKLGVNIHSGGIGDFKTILCDFKDILSLSHCLDSDTKIQELQNWLILIHWSFSLKAFQPQNVFIRFRTLIYCK